MTTDELNRSSPLDAPRDIGSARLAKVYAQAIVEAAGGIVLDLNGNPLRYEFNSSKKNPLFFCTGDSSYPWKDIFSKLI